MISFIVSIKLDINFLILMVDTNIEINDKNNQNHN